MCLDLHSILMLIIWCVIIGALVAILRVVIPRYLGDPGSVVLQILSILIGAIVIIAVLVVVFNILSCFAGGGFGLGLRR